MGFFTNMVIAVQRASQDAKINQWAALAGMADNFIRLVNSGSLNEIRQQIIKNKSQLSSYSGDLFPRMPATDLFAEMHYKVYDLINFLEKEQPGFLRKVAQSDTIFEDFGGSGLSSRKRVAMLGVLRGRKKLANYVICQILSNNMSMEASTSMPYSALLLSSE